MSLELTYLIWSAALGFVYLNTQALLFRMQVGIKAANNQRDHDEPSNLLTARGERALRNFLESYAIFVALAVATELSGRSDALTQWGCHLYFWARVVYLPLYVSGVSPARSIVWTLSAIGLTLLFIGVVV